MEIKNKLLILVISLWFFLVSTNFVNAQPIYDCQTLDSGHTVYRLQNDVIASGTCFIIEADNVVFDIGGHRIIGDGTGYGILTGEYHSRIIIKNGKIGNFSQGIRIQRTSNSKVMDNYIEGNAYGMYILQDSNNNLILHNKILNSTQRGINIDGSENNYIVKNEILNTNWEGLFLGAFAYNNYVYGNTIEHNCYGIPNRGGIFISVSDNNTIYHNNLINNNNQVGGTGINFWYNNVLEEGNYWSDYDEESEGCYDLDLNRICDSPYIIDKDNQDNYPFVNINGWLNY